MGILLLFALLFPSALWSQATQPAGEPPKTQLASSYRITVLVADLQPAMDKINAWNEARGGWFFYRDSGRLSLRVPNAQLQALVQELRNSSLALVDIQPSSRDLGEQLAALSVRIATRETMIKRSLELLGTADLGGTLAIESELTDMHAELDSLKGQQRKLVQERDMALVELYFSFNAGTLPQKRSSPYAWINTLDFYRFLNE